MKRLTETPRGQRPRAIVLAGQRVTYTVRRSPRAKHLRLRVLPESGLEVVAPQRGTLPPLEPLLRERAGWILDALARVAISPRATRAGMTLRYRGAGYRLVTRVCPGQAPAVRLDEAAGTLDVRVPDQAMLDTGLDALLESWYRNEARAALLARVTARAAELGVTFGRLTLRDQRTRWGSCSSLGNLNFNWRLILAPDAVLDYVVVHELAHRREANHGARFWAIVAAHCPDYQTHRAWLRHHGHELLAPWQRAE